MLGVPVRGYGMSVVMDKIVGRDGYHRSRVHDEKGNRVPLGRLLEVPASLGIRVSQKIIERPALPWLPFSVIRRLRAILTADSRVLEFGSGRSTVWLARHSGTVWAIEDDELWYSKVSQLLHRRNILNVNYVLAIEKDYFDLSSDVDDLDLVIVDGSWRPQCVESAVGRVRAGGTLYLDNSDKDAHSMDGEMRLAERAVRTTAEVWGGSIERFVGYAPGNLFPHEGLLIRRPM